jgi:hypothetical protein
MSPRIEEAFVRALKAAGLRASIEQPIESRST